MKQLLLSLLLLLLANTLSAGVWNSPHNTDQPSENILFTSFSSPVKHLDPVISYNSAEWGIIGQIYEPPLQYNYLKRPYVLEPATLTAMPEVHYLDKNGQTVDVTSKNIAFSEYIFHLRDDIRFQPHPSFVKDTEGRQRYAKLTGDELDDITSLDDFALNDSRLLQANDYIYAIKRMAVRQNHSPILDSMMAYIIGLKDYSKDITNKVKALKKDKKIVDLRSSEISGIKQLDPLTFSIRIKGVYPQFLYWMSMNFFAPIPWEADLFYQQAGLKEKNLTLDSFPVGTGPYYLAENNPNKQMRLVANPNFHTELYPSLSPEEQKASGVPDEMLVDSGKPMPFIKEVIYSLEKESIPLWNKFLQGYYDSSGIASEAFDQTINISTTGAMGLSPEMEKRGITLRSAIVPSIYYMAFNMVDPVVGGYSESNQKLRQAISIAIHYEEYISIFRNDRGIAAQGPIPPGIFGYDDSLAGHNNYVYDSVEGKSERKPIAYAKQLLTEAGYPNGTSSKTGKPLTIHYDATSAGPDQRAQLDWMRKQFKKLGILLVIRNSDYNRFQDKIRNGSTQMFMWGWNADYPDPENFLFLLYGGNAAVDTGGSGINSSNYKNPEFDRLFDQMNTMENSPERLAIIQQMLEIARKDSPWIWGFHPKSLGLYHHWFGNAWPNQMANNTMKYKRIDDKKRRDLQSQWNQPVLLPIIVFFILIIGIIYPLLRAYRKRQAFVIQTQ
ncbi:MAG: ABC transporter substrate-binding protein [Thiotrichaceae bacterium]|nr:ABC transporter substrate-binding protein [Thiotrichaceae bacterium]